MKKNIIISLVYLTPVRPFSRVSMALVNFNDIPSGIFDVTVIK